MSVKKSRKRCLPPQTLETVSKFLPENNEEKPKGYPVSFSEFCASTNVRDVTVEVIKRTKYKTYKIYLENEDCIRAQEYNFYIHFYKSKESRNCSPLCDIKVNEDCSEAHRKLVLSFCKTSQIVKKFPVSFEKFCKYTNCAEIVNETLKARGWTFGSNTWEWGKIARKLYLNFYTSEEKRKKYNVRIKPCTKTLKNQLLKFAEDIEPTGTEANENTEIAAKIIDPVVPVVPEAFNGPSPKRARLSPKAYAQINDSVTTVENNFPASYDTFLMHTNVKDLAVSHLKAIPKTSFDAFDVADLTRKLYIEFYTKPRYENYLFNELFVRHNYADVITGLPTVSKESGLISSTNNQKRVENEAEKQKVIIQSVEILKPLVIEPNYNNVICNTENIQRLKDTMASAKSCDDALKSVVNSDSPNSEKKTAKLSFPVSFESFRRYSNLEKVVEKLMIERTGQKSVEYTAPIWLNTAKEVYENFYKFPEKRVEYGLTFKPLPKNIKQKMLNFHFETDSKENRKKESDFEDINTDPILPVTSTIEQKNDSAQEDQQTKQLERSDGNMSSTSIDNNENILDLHDPVDCALRSMFEDDNNETVVHKSASEDNLSTSPNKKLQAAISDLPESPCENQTSSGESIKPHQETVNDAVTDFTHTDIFQGLTQFQSQSLLQSQQIDNFTNSPESLNVNYINMPNTQQQFNALLNDHHYTSQITDPLYNSTECPEIRSIARITSPEPSSLEKEKCISVDKNGNTATLTNQGEKENVDAKVKLVPLKNLQFTIDENGNDFNVTAFVEEPVLLNDSQDINMGYMSTKSGKIKRIFSNLAFSSQDLNCTIPVVENEKTLHCTEAQRFLSSGSDNSQQIQSLNSLNCMTKVHNFPVQLNANGNNAAKGVENPKDIQSKPTSHRTDQTKKPVYRVIKSKNLAYNVPQILHDFRALPIEAGLVKKKQHLSEKSHI